MVYHFRFEVQIHIIDFGLNVPYVYDNMTAIKSYMSIAIKEPTGTQNSRSLFPPGICCSKVIMKQGRHEYMFLMKYIELYISGKDDSDDVKI